MMEQEDRWNQFAATGKVKDYLEYRESMQRVQEEPGEKVSAKDFSGAEAGQEGSAW